MKIEVAKPAAPVFHPVTITCETREDLAVLLAALSVAHSREVGNHASDRLFGGTGQSSRLESLHCTQYMQVATAYVEATES